MRFSPLLLSLVGLVAAPLAMAFVSIDTDLTATAGSPFDVEVTNDLNDDDSFDGMFDSYRVYLAMTPPGWGTGPACFLVNSTSINTTNLTVTIPASVGPSGRFYSISTMEYNNNTSDNSEGPSGFEYSSDFNLQGATGNWSQYELDGYTIGDPDSIPCNAYECARNCSSAYYPANVGLGDSADQALQATYDCIQACPGVWFSDEGEDEGDGGDGDEGSSSMIGFGTAAGSSGTTSAFFQPATTATMRSTSARTTLGAGSSTSTSSKASSSVTATSSPTSSASATATKNAAARFGGGSGILAVGVAVLPLVLA